MHRRSFLGLGLAAVGGIFAPKYGQWYKQGRGLLVRDVTATTSVLLDPMHFEFYAIGGPALVRVDLVDAHGNVLASSDAKDGQATIERPQGYHEIRTHWRGPSGVSRLAAARPA